MRAYVQMHTCTCTALACCPYPHLGNKPFATRQNQYPTASPQSLVRAKALCIIASLTARPTAREQNICTYSYSALALAVALAVVLAAALAAALAAFFKLSREPLLILT